MFVIISRQLVKMFLLMMVGVVCRKSNLVNHEGNKVLSNVLLLVINPMLIIDSFQVECTPQLLRGVLTAIVLSLVIHVIAIVLGELLLRGGDRDASAIERCAIVYSNCGFMGIPLIHAVLGSTGVIYLTAFILVFNILIWTHALFVMTGKADRQQLMNGLRSPTVISTLLGFILFVCHIKLPEVVGDSISYIAVMNTAMGMLVAGISLAESNLLASMRRPRTYFICALRLLATPLITLAIFAFLPLEQELLFSLLIAAACPTATTCIMFALRYGKDEKYASELFTVSTLLSLVTIPAVIFIAERVL